MDIFTTTPVSDEVIAKLSEGLSYTRVGRSRPDPSHGPDFLPSGGLAVDRVYFLALSGEEEDASSPLSTSGTTSLLTAPLRARPAIATRTRTTAPSWSSPSGRSEPAAASAPRASRGAAARAQPWPGGSPST